METSTHDAAFGTRIAGVLSYVREMHHEDDNHDRGEEHAPFFLGQISDKAGRMYEKLRAAVDNKEEHFLRRYAIRRIVKRVMWFSHDPQVVTGRMLRDLYKGGYLPEDRVSLHVEQDIVHTISTFLTFSGEVTRSKSAKELFVMKKHLLDICAGVIEDHIYPTYIDEASVRLLARIGDETMILSSDLANEHDRAMLIYIAAWKALFGADQALLVYKLWLYKHPAWSHTGDEELLQLGALFPAFIADCERLFVHPILPKLTLRLRSHSIAVSVIHELLLLYGDGIESLMANPVGFQDKVRTTITGMYRKDISHASRKAVNAVVYILATKAVLALMIESVYVSVFKASINYIALVANVVFHPALLFVSTSGLSVPSVRNTERLTLLVGDIVSSKVLTRTEITPLRSGFFGELAIGLYWGLLVCLLAAISWALLHLGFHAVDIVLFIVFLALVLYFAFRVRYGARRMELSGAKEGFLRSTLELIALPIVSVGRWMVTKFESLNVFAVFLDVVIETPLRLLLEFLDSFSAVLKEKKDEIYS